MKSLGARTIQKLLDKAGDMTMTLMSDIMRAVRFYNEVNDTLTMLLLTV